MNNLPLPDEFYRMASASAVGAITLNPQMVAGQSVTIDGVTYTLGTDFGQANSYQYIPAIAARGLAEAINGAEFDSRNGTLFRLPHPTVFALPMANQVVLFSRLSGTSGNSLAISTSSAGSFGVSGATLSGGAAAPAYESSTIDSKTATTSTGEVLAANPARKTAVIVNYGATNGVFLAFGTPAISGKGVYLAPNGGSYELNSTNLTHLAINAITALSTTTLSIHEGS